MPNLATLNLKLNRCICITGIILLGGCSSTSILIPDKGKTQEGKTVPADKQTERTSDSPIRPSAQKKEIPLEDELDFAMAFVDSSDDRSPPEPKIPVLPETGDEEKEIPKKIQSFYVPSTMVRVALLRNISRVTLYSFGTVNIYAGRRSRTASCKGRIAASISRKKRTRAGVILDASKVGKFEVSLPCTLLAKSTENYFEVNEESFRGSIILAKGRSGTFFVINYCTMEDYLRGVVPLEIGKRKVEEIEAVKAQAVAARTYTYKKMLANAGLPFDLVATVADQVYGGVTVEYPLSDRAIQMTKGMVLAHGDSLIFAYYHSTCGGVTANIRDVWNKGPAPYLCSVKDVDEKGEAYCSISKYFTWQESWKTSTLASILWRYTDKNSKNHFPIKGRIKNITVAERFPCGRISVCRVVTQNGIYEYGGDNIRFTFRRNMKEYPILRSSHFEVINVDPNKVLIRGRGYGHGVGMCQMGAIGRARAGQSFGEILDAYYIGSYIATVTVEKNRKKAAYE